MQAYMIPYLTRTLRCNYCGSTAGPGCRCREEAMWNRGNSETDRIAVTLENRKPKICVSISDSPSSSFIREESSILSAIRKEKSEPDFISEMFKKKEPDLFGFKKEKSVLDDILKKDSPWLK